MSILGGLPCRELHTSLKKLLNGCNTAQTRQKIHWKNEKWSELEENSMLGSKSWYDPNQKKELLWKLAANCLTRWSMCWTCQRHWSFVKHVRVHHWGFCWSSFLGFGRQILLGLDYWQKRRWHRENLEVTGKKAWWLTILFLRFLTVALIPCVK